MILSEYLQLNESLKLRIDKQKLIDNLEKNEQEFIFFLRMYLNTSDNNIIFSLLEKLNDKYKEIKSLYVFLTKTCMYTPDTLITETKKHDTDLEEALYLIADAYVQTHDVDPFKVPEKVKMRNKVLFFYDLDETLRDRIDYGTFDVEDYLDNYDKLKNREQQLMFYLKPWSNMYRLIEIFTEEELEFLINNHKSFMILFCKSNFKFGLKKKDINLNLDEKILLLLKTNPQNTSILPNYLKDLNYTNLESMLKSNALSSLIKNYILELTERFGLNNILEFDRKNDNLLTKDGLKNLVILNNYSYSKDSANTYEEMLNLIYDALKGYFRYGGIDDEYLDISNFASSFKNTNYSDIFLYDNELEKLNITERVVFSKKFYNGALTIEDIMNHPEYTSILVKKDLSLAMWQMMKEYGYYEVKSIIDTIGNENLFRLISVFGSETTKIWSSNNFILHYNDKEDIVEIGNKVLHELIMFGRIDYYNNLPESFKKSFPELFLNDGPKELMHLFENKELTLEYFEKNPEDLKYFTNTDLFVGFNKKYITFVKISKPPYTRVDNEKKLKILRQFEKFGELRSEIRWHIIDYFERNFKTLTDSQISLVYEIVNRLVYSNSNKLSRIAPEMCDEILSSDDPITNLDKIEQLYLSGYLPDVAKVYQVFKILHKNTDGSIKLNLIDESSPVLKSHSSSSAEVIIFSDLMKCAVESNNLSLRNYIITLEESERLIERYDNYENFSDEERVMLRSYSKMLCALYNQTLYGKNNRYNLCDDVVQDILTLKKLLNVPGKINDRLVSMFMHFIGIDDLDTLKKTIDKKLINQDAENRESIKIPFNIEVGDFIKGIGNIKYFQSTFKNGIVSKEFLGSGASTDSTPLDTDFSRILHSEDTIRRTIARTTSDEYGPVWIVVKRSNPNLYISRGYKAEETGKYVRDKIEMFPTLAEGEWGARTAVGLCNVCALITDNYKPFMGLEIAKYGAYIPIRNTLGEVIFTPEMFDSYYNQMEGLTYYGHNSFTVSPMVSTREIETIASNLENDKIETQKKCEIINHIIGESLRTLGFKIKYSMDGNLEPGTIEVLNIGSTGRGTNEPEISDYDFLIRIDNNIMKKPERLKLIKEALKKALNAPDNSFKWKSIKIEGLDLPIDLDISFKPKTDDIVYSSDAAIRDRLNTVKRENPEYYSLVLANIIYAKKILKENNCYYGKTHSKCVYAGIGGIGVENWILSHHGSFIEAAEDFLRVASVCKNYEEFREKYKIWNFGENFYYEMDEEMLESNNKHNEFISDSMSEVGFEQMKTVLQKELNKISTNELEPNIL